MRPRLREDVRFAECPDGVYLHSDHGVCTIRGRQAYAWLSRLAPALTGDRSLAEITAGLPADRREVVDRLISALAEQRFVVDAGHDEPHDLTDAEQQTYAAEIAFIGYALASPHRRFQRVRRARLVLVGAGPLIPALVTACLASGWRDVRVVTSMGGLEDVARQGSRDPAQRVRVVRVPSMVVDAPVDLTARLAHAGVAAELVHADVVLQVDTEVDALVAVCRSARGGVVLGQALVRPDEIWLGQTDPAQGAAAVESAWRRLTDVDGDASPRANGASHGATASASPESGAGESGVGESGAGESGVGESGAGESGVGESGAGESGVRDLLVGPVPDVVAAELALAAFASLTGLAGTDAADNRAIENRGGDERAGGKHAVADTGTADDRGATTLTRIDLATLAAHRYPALRHPITGRSAAGLEPRGGHETRREIESLAAAAPTTRSELLERAGGGVVNPRTGLLRSLGEEDLTQLPLWVCRATTAALCGRPGVAVVGWADDPGHARSRALMGALACYGYQAMALVRADTRRSWWAGEPSTGRVHALPPGAVAGRSPRPGNGVIRGAGGEIDVPVGVAAGLSWSAAVAAGLRAHCERLLETIVVDRHSDQPVVDRPGLPSDGPVQAMLEQLAVLGVAVRIRDATGVLGLPAYVFEPTTGARTEPGRPPGTLATVVSCAGTPQRAVRDGLERVLLAWQLGAANRSAAGAPRSPVRAAPPPARWLDGAEPEGVEAFTAALHRAGRRPLVLPLTIDAAAARILPFVAWTVLCEH